MPCELTLRYQEKVSLNPSVADPPQIPETDYPTLSEEVLAYLHPSRYCESERLASFAMAECGGLDCGYSRVAAVVNDLQPSANISGSTNASTGACIALVLLIALGSTWSFPRSTRRIRLVAQTFALFLTLVGIFTIVVGVGPRTVPDIVYHIGIIAVLAYGLTVTARAE